MPRSPPLAIQRRQTVDQQSRIRMSWRGDDLCDRCDLDQPSCVHDAEPIDELRHQAHVMTHQDHRGAQLRLHAPECFHHLPLHHHIQRAGWFIGNDYFRLQADRDRDARALLHAARQFMRILVRGLRRQPNMAQQITHPLVQLAPRQLRAVIGDRVADLITNPHHRVERIHRSLRHHRDAGQPQPPHRIRRKLRERRVLQPDLAAIDAAGRLDHAQDGECHGGLARSRLAGQPEPFMRAQREADIVHRTHHAERVVVGDAQSVDAQYFAVRPDHAVRRSRGLAISSSPTVRKNSPRNTITITTSGAVHHHHQPLMIAALKNTQ